MRNAENHRQNRLADRLFLGGCTAAYVVLLSSVIAALKFYNG